VGKTSAGLSTAGVQLDATGSGGFCRAETCLTLSRLSTDGSILDFRKDSTTVGSIGTYSGTLAISSANTGIMLDDTNNILRPTNASGGSRDGIISLGNPSQRFKNIYTSGGIYLGGTVSANALDDYEEGTWTPTMTGATFSTNYTCRYTKIGNLVNLDLAIEMTSAGNTHLQISGLPFTSIAGVWGGDIWTNGWSGEPGHVRYWAGSTSIAFYSSNGSGGVNAINQSTIGGSGGNIFGTITYMTNS
jgi:hypothetical protein